MDLEQIKSLLPEDKRDEVFGTIQSLIQAEKDRGITEKSQANDEAKGLRQKYKKPLAEIFGEDIPEDWHSHVKTWKEKVNKDLPEMDKTKNSYASEVEKLRAAQDELNKRLMAMQGERESELKEVSSTAINAALASELSGKIYNDKAVIKAISLGGDIQYDHKSRLLSWKGADGKPVDFKAGLDQYLIDQGIEYKVNQKPGAGSSGSAGSPDAMSKEAKEAAIREQWKNRGISPRH